MGNIEDVTPKSNWKVHSTYLIVIVCMLVFGTFHTINQSKRQMEAGSRLMVAENDLRMCTVDKADLTKKTADLQAVLKENDLPRREALSHRVTSAIEAYCK